MNKVNSTELQSPEVSTVILIPAFNEEQTIFQVITQIRQNCSFPVVVIDDCSSDDTAGQARRAGATVLPLAVQLGAWGATQTGLRYACRQGYQVAITMDADGQHEAASIPALVRPVTQGSADVAIGACTSRGSKMRKIAWVIMKKASGLSLEDITSGFRVYNQRAISELSGWRATLLDYQDIGVLLMLQACGLKIVDVEVDMKPRLNGASRVFHSWVMVAYYMCHSILLGLTKRNTSLSRHSNALAL